MYSQCGTDWQVRFGKVAFESPCPGPFVPSVCFYLHEDIEKLIYNFFTGSSNPLPYPFPTHIQFTEQSTCYYIVEVNPSQALRDCFGDTAGNWTNIGNAISKFYTDSNVSKNIIYYYKVKAYNAIYESDYSNVDSAEVISRSASIHLTAIIFIVLPTLPIGQTLTAYPALPHLMKIKMAA